MAEEKEKKAEEKKVEAKAEEKPKAKEEKPKAEKKEREAPKAELSGKPKVIFDALKDMTVLELSDLVKTLEDEFGVSAQAPVAMVGAAMPGAAAGQAAEEEKTSFTVVLKETGPNKIQVIKEIRTVTSLGLKEAKDLVEAAPKPVKEGATKEEAEKMKAQLEKVGAKVELT